MLLGLSAQQKQQWSNSLHLYQKNKRTKRPFGLNPSTIQRRSTIDVIQKQMKFNPVLQSFRDARQQSKTIQQEEIHRANQQIKYIKNNYKYAPNYDIINLSQGPQSLPTVVHQQPISQNRKKQYKDPTYQAYNIINGRQYPEGYLKKVGLKAQRHYDRNKHAEESRIYNIVNGRYVSNHEERDKKEQYENHVNVMNRSQEIRVYDSINGRYYNPEVQQQYQAKRQKEQIRHSQKSPKLPPSYLNRQPLVLAQGTEPTPLVKELEKKAELSKQRYKLRRLVEQQHQRRGESLSLIQEERSKRRMERGHVLEDLGREFDIINSQRYAKNRQEEIFGKEVTGSPYQPNPIKSNAF